MYSEGGLLSGKGTADVCMVPFFAQEVDVMISGVVMRSFGVRYRVNTPCVLATAHARRKGTRPAPMLGRSLPVLS